MKAITICQPYAELIARGIKRVENRKWPTHHRGPIAIHAGKGAKYWTDEYGFAAHECDWGAVVATANLIACIPQVQISGGNLVESLMWLRTHEHAEGPFCWVLTDIVRLAVPISIRGAQGLWDITGDALEAPIEQAKAND